MTPLLEGLTGDAQQQDVARRVATLRSARRMAPAASWASWVDLIIAALELDEAPGCLGELQQQECSTVVVLLVGQVGPSFGSRPSAPADHELGEWTRPPPSNFTFGRP